MWAWITQQDNAIAVTAVVAIIALLQPWLINLYKKRKARITIIPNKSFILNFGNYGLNIELYFTLVSKNVENIISSVAIEIKRGSNDIYNFDWMFFNAPYNQSYTNSFDRVNFDSFTPAHPIYLAKDKPELLRVTLSDSAVSQKIAKFIENQDRDSMLLQCKWETGDYDVIFSVTDGKGRVYQYKYAINVDDELVKSLRGNVDKVLSNHKTNLANQEIQAKIDAINTRKDIEWDEKLKLTNEVGEKGKLEDIHNFRVKLVEKNK